MEAFLANKNLDLDVIITDINRQCCLHKKEYGTQRNKTFLVLFSIVVCVLVYVTGKTHLDTQRQ